MWTSFEAVGGDEGTFVIESDLFGGALERARAQVVALQHVSCVDLKQLSENLKVGGQSDVL